MGLEPELGKRVGGRLYELHCVVDYRVMKE